jgi:hypothetical protein
VLRTNPSKHWERFDRDDPNYGVVSQEAMRAASLDHHARARFFESGEEQVHTWRFTCTTSVG